MTHPLQSVTDELNAMLAEAGAVDAAGDPMRWTLDTDGDRIAAEARHRAQQRAQAAERQRPILFTTPSGGQFTDTQAAIIHPGFCDMTTDEREAAIAAATK